MAIDRGHSNWEGELSVGTFAKPDAFIFKELMETPVSAWVCVGCGYVEFYADYPKSIKVKKI